MTTKTSVWDSADYLKTEEDINDYLEAAFQDGGADPEYILHVLGVVARAKNMSQLSRDTGMSREGLYKALAADGNPSFKAIAKVSNALGLKLSISGS